MDVVSSIIDLNVAITFKGVIKLKKILITATKALLYFVGWTLLVSFIPVPDFENPAIWRFAAELIPFLCIIGISILFWLIEKRSVKIFSLFNPIRNCLIGIVSGIAWLGLSFCIMSLSGVLKITQVNLVSMLWLWILSAFINTIMQELLVRGYLYQMIKTKHNIIAATIVSTALFTFMHGGAFEAGIIPVLNVLTMSLLMTVVLEYTQSLLTPIIMHFLWNSVGAIVLGGVSLADDYPNLLTATFSGNALLSGGIYKMEGSIIVSFVNIVLICLFVFLLIKQKKIAKS